SLSLTLTIPRPSRSTLFPSRRSSDLSDTFIAGEAFACYHRLVKGRASFYYDPVNWDSLAGSDHKHVVNSDVLDRNLDLATVSEDPGHRGLEFEELPNRLGGSLLGQVFEEVSGQYQSDD